MKNTLGLKGHIQAFIGDDYGNDILVFEEKNAIGNIARLDALRAIAGTSTSDFTLSSTDNPSVVFNTAPTAQGDTVVVNPSDTGQEQDGAWGYSIDISGESENGFTSAATSLIIKANFKFGASSQSLNGVRLIKTIQVNSEDVDLIYAFNNGFSAEVPATKSIKLTWTITA